MVKDIVYFQNTVTFKIDRSFDIEYPNRKYGIFLDLTADAASGKPAVEEIAAAIQSDLYLKILLIAGKLSLLDMLISS